jgi:multisubunit Na+/H+ antiporter MnhG subunit
MSFDFMKTLKLIQGGLLDHTATWNDYLAGNPGWKDTAIVLTGPLLVANIVLSLIFSRIVGGFAYYGYHSNFFVALVMGLIMAAIGFSIAVLVFNFLAGVFNGKPDFSRTFAAVSLAAIPAWTAGIVASIIPSVGFLIALAGGIISLVFLYKILPLALELPDEKRVVHFVVSLVAIFIINAVVGFMMGQGAMRQGVNSADFTRAERSSDNVKGSGVIGEMERQGRLMEAAAADVFEPPSDGELDEDQVEEYISVMQKTRAMHKKYAEEMDRMAREMKEKEEAGETPSLSDLGKMYGGIGTAMTANNAEMEVVKTGGGNWAEHQWVKEQLRAAAIQQGEGSDALEHNYELYKKYEDELEDDN